MLLKTKKKYSESCFTGSETKNKKQEVFKRLLFILTLIIKKRLLFILTLIIKKKIQLFSWHSIKFNLCNNFKRQLNCLAIRC